MRYETYLGASAVAMVAMLGATQAQAQSQVFDVAGQPLNFGTGVGSGNGVGASRSYTNIITIDGQQIDAVVTVTALNGVTLDAFDSTTNPYSQTNFLQPSLTINSVGGYAEMRIDFYSGGQPVTLGNFYVNTYDLDGSQASASGRQFTDLGGFASYTLSSTTRIARQSSTLGTRFVTTLGGNVTDPPGGAQFNDIRARVFYTSANTLTVRLGDAGATGIAYYALDFSIGYAFSNAATDTQAPTVTANQSFDYAENRSVNDQVATVSASDNIGVTGYRFASGATTSADGYYQINANGEIRITAAGIVAGIANNDFEIAPNAFAYDVVASDLAGNTSAPVSVALNVTNLSEPPRITGPSGGSGATTSTVSVPEEQTAVTTLSADQSVTWSIAGGTDQSFFSIDPATGELVFDNAPDFENPLDTGGNNTYEVQVQAVGPDGTSNQTITVTVTDMAETPLGFTGTNSTSGGNPAYAFSYQENASASVTLGTVTGTGGDPAYTYAITTGDPGNLLMIDSATGAISLSTAGAASAANDFEAAPNSRTITVTVTDDRGATSSIPVILNETDEDDSAPVITAPGAAAGAATASVTVDEGTNRSVGQFSADENVTWTISGNDAADFAIDASGNLTFVADPDFEAPADQGADNVYDIVISAEDATGNIATQTVTVTVRDIDDTAPVITGPSGAAGAASAAVSVDEPDQDIFTFGANEPVTWSISGGPDATALRIDANTGQLTFANPTDFENPADADGNNVYLVTISARDGNGNINTQNVAVTVNDVDDTAPVVGTGDNAQTVFVDEGRTAVTTLTADEAVTWSITGGVDRTQFSIDAASGAVSFVTAPDFEAPADADGNNSYIVEVTASDGAGNDAAVTLTVNVRDVDDTAALITGPGGAAGDAAITLQRPEGQADVGSFSANEAGSFSITGGADAALFEITATGDLAFTVAPDFETPGDADNGNDYIVEITFTDGANNTSVQTVTVEITDVDDTAPDITIPGIPDGNGAARIEVDEGEVEIATLIASENVRWSITGGADADRFVLDPVTGVLSFGQAPDFENPTDANADNSYVFTVTATDDNDNITERTITVVVQDVDDSAPVITVDGLDPATGITELSIDEGGLPVVNFASDEPVTFAVTGGPDANLLTIDPQTGALSFREAPDFEAPADADGDNVYQIEIMATDAAGNSVVIRVNVAIADVDDSAPLITGPSGGEGAQESATSLPEGGFEAVTFTADEDVVWTIAGGADAARFAIDPQTGELVFREETDFEAPGDADGDNVYLVEVSATDPNGNSARQNVRVTVTDIDEIAQKLDVIGDALRSDLKGWALRGLGDMLAINESLLSTTGAANACAPGTRKFGGNLNATQDYQTLEGEYHDTLTACDRPWKVLVDLGASASGINGDWSTRSYGSLRLERAASDDITLGLGVLGSTGSGTLPSFEVGDVFDRTLQVTGYGRANITTLLRAGLWGSIGRSWYDFSLFDPADGFDLEGTMEGNRLAFGAQLSGDVISGRWILTPDIAISHAREDLGEASLDARYRGENREGISFFIGDVDMTRISAPLRISYRIDDFEPITGRATGIMIGPGLLCEEYSIDTSQFECGYQIGAQLAHETGDRAFVRVDYRYEDVALTQRHLFGAGLGYRFGKRRDLELALDANRATRLDQQTDDRAFISLRITR